MSQDASVLKEAIRKRRRNPKIVPNEPVQDADIIVKNKDEPRNGLAIEVLENLRRFPHCLLLTRVGQFYESYFDQATEIAHLLNIKLTTRKWDGQRIYMCGFPLAHLDKHLKVLVQQNKRFVAMCEEFPRYSDSGNREFERRVVRIVTPGTLIDESFLNPFENNYVLALSSDADYSTSRNALGLAWMDVSTGEFFSKSSTYENLQDELARINPKEVVLEEHLRSCSSHPVLLALAEENACISYVTSPSVHPEARETKMEVNLQDSCLTSNCVGVTSFQSTSGTSLSVDELSSINILHTFLRANLLEYMPTVISPHQEVDYNRMQIDSHTIKALEIRESINEGGTKGSLMSAIKRTTTSSGTRLLTRWLCSPSTSLSEINARQSSVSLFFLRPHFRTDLVKMLRDTEDTGRIVQKFLLGRGDVSDLLALNRAISVWSSIKRRIYEEKQFEMREQPEFNKDDWSSIVTLIARMPDLHFLFNRISNAIEETDGLIEGIRPALPHDQVSEVASESDAPTQMLPTGSSVSNVMRSGPGRWVIKQSFSEQIATLHREMRELLEQREYLERRLQTTHDTPFLSLRASPAHGFHVHLAKAKREQAKLNNSTEFVSIAESASTKCYFNKEWSQLGSRITETTTALNIAEKEAFDALRKEVNLSASSFRRGAQIIDEIDISLAFASIATEMNFVKPVLTSDLSYNVSNGRHPTVELGLLTSGRVFTPNSVDMTADSRLHIITGPNMAGKSTFLRQTALIAIMAQIGSFVPADSATIGIVDKVFSRIGAKDDLFHDRSTFMVEMLETADILRRATPRSLVIMDEVGRGTTVRDGLAIAFATVQHLSEANQCRALFATHFHELADMLGYRSNGIHELHPHHIRFYCTDVKETDDNQFTYTYRLRPGVNRDSHGLKVAQLAGMPPTAIQVAKNTLSWLNKHESILLPDCSQFIVTK
ncbi:hypothetical protein AMATHDRAFT_72435 [Amanita thiersii Skay4041]|uniref:DNA mismatch repair proteins mutS family domain-containing protein n=1 Tax=Amanita thiersii Skay4041 TaxID=703135 RepID=A0A2A9NWV1_9AGAR|nr:hypothetical protein AMATHDRAFT_72435 [Amanita thiersii Skay4041]